MDETIVRLEPLPVTVTELPLTALPVEAPPTNTSLATVTAPPPVMAKELSLLSEPTRSLLVSAQVVPTPSTVPALPSEPALRPKRALLPVTVAPLVAEKALPEPVLPITRAARLENEPPLTARRFPVAEAASPTITSLAVPYFLPGAGFAVAGQDGEEGVDDLPLAGFVPLPAGGSVLPHGEVDLQGEGGEACIAVAAVLRHRPRLQDGG